MLITCALKNIDLTVVFGSTERPLRESATMFINALFSPLMDGSLPLKTNNVM